MARASQGPQRIRLEDIWSSRTSPSKVRASSSATKRGVSLRFATRCGGVFTDAGFEEVIVPALWYQRTFIAKGGPEIVEQMYAFDDKARRPICLVPEITGPLQEAWRDVWSKQSKQKRVFYVARCYRYEAPQLGRYREFTQVGVELFGNAATVDRREVVDLLRSALNLCRIPYTIDENVKRGLGYYTEDGFEARCDLLGAQKQIAGGGRYAEGIGWAIGLDRVLLAQSLILTG